MYIYWVKKCTGDCAVLNNTTGGDRSYLTPVDDNGFSIHT